MSTVWVVVIVVAVVVIVAVVVMRRPRGEPGEVRERAEVAAEEPAGLEEEEPAVAPKAARTPEKVTAAEPEAVPEPRPGAQAEEETREPLEGAGAGMGTETAEAEVEEKRAETPRPPSADELRERVESQLGEAGRMLAELKEAVEEKEGEAPVDASMLAILEEGLQEVRSLVEKKRLDQARDKGEALHSQLALFLQTARREQSS